LRALNADNGKTAAIWVTPLPRLDPSVARYFDLQTGKIRREVRYDFLEKGGLAAGAKEESWLRQVVRNYDANTGNLKSEGSFARWEAHSSRSKSSDRVRT